MVFDPLWDSLLLGALVFYSGNLVLGKVGPYAYYFAPGDFVVLLSLFGLLSKPIIRGPSLLALALILISINIVHSIGYANLYRALSKDYSNALNFVENTVRSGRRVNLHIDADGREPLQGIRNALRFRGLKVSGFKQSMTSGFLEVTTPDIPEAHSTPPDILDLYYVGFFYFYLGFEERISRIKNYQQSPSEFVQVYPMQSGGKDGTQNFTHIFAPMGTNLGSSQNPLEIFDRSLIQGRIPAKQSHN